METSVEQFRKYLGQVPIIDPNGTHHEFAGGSHGQKIDMGVIKRGTFLHDFWLDINEDFVRKTYDPLPEFLVGIADGTNDFSDDLADRFEGKVESLRTEKTPDDKIILPPAATERIRVVKPKLLVLVEDVSNEGTHAIQPAEQALAAGAERVELLTTWQRRKIIRLFNEAGIIYHALIKEEMPTYTPEECRELVRGFCNRGWELIKRK